MGERVGAGIDGTKAILAAGTAAANLLLGGCGGDGILTHIPTQNPGETTLITPVCGWETHVVGVQVNEAGESIIPDGAYREGSLELPGDRWVRLYDPERELSWSGAPEEERQDLADRNWDATRLAKTWFQLTLNEAGEITLAEPLPDRPITFDELRAVCADPVPPTQPT